MSQRVLIVDDNADNRKLIAWLLEDEGWDFDEAETAESGLELIYQNDYGVVLMDISLPGMSGDEATRQLRAQPQFASLPIIAVTAHAIKGEKEKILASGVTSLMTKPIDEDQLLALLQELLSET